jgi:hypothetical protein
MDAISSAALLADARIFALELGQHVLLDRRAGLGLGSRCPRQRFCTPWVAVLLTQPPAPKPKVTRAATMNFDARMRSPRSRRCRRGSPKRAFRRVTFALVGDSVPARAGAAGAAVLANGVLVGVLLVAAALVAWRPEAYYRVVQEDEVLEWASFWAFAGAAAVFAWAGLRGGARGWRLWFPAGLALFCLWVALEEISWGQRVFGYRPPAYFLENNYQQELNVHNVVGQDLRQLALKAVILGYGVFLPLLGLIPALRSLLDRLGVVAPPLALVPGFLATYALYEVYPWEFSGEWVEMMLGLGFLFVAVLWSGGRETGPGLALVGVVVACGLVAGGGLASAAWSRSQRQEHPQTLEAARAELSALSRDFREARLRTSCGLHQRLFTFARANEVEELAAGRFAALVRQGLPEERSRFFLDPWNTPYWVRDACGENRKRRRIFVYSFGPDRMRDSTDWEIRGDDLGEIVFDAHPE